MPIHIYGDISQYYIKCRDAIITSGDDFHYFIEIS